MKKDIGIAETEWKVMELLWQNMMMTIGEIKQGLAETDWSASTIKTLVRRLVAKGAVGIDESEGHFRYYAIANEGECRQRETRNLINRVYHGSVKMLMANLASDCRLTEEEAEQLKLIIDKLDGGENT